MKRMSTLICAGEQDIGQFRVFVQSQDEIVWRSNVYGQSFLWLPRMGRISFALNNCVEVCGSNQLVSPLLLGTVAHELLWLFGGDY